MVNSLEYINIKYKLHINEKGKKNIPGTILKANTSCVLHEQYPEPEWTRAYTDGSKIQNNAGADVYSKLFPVGHFMSNFGAEICTTSLTLENLKKKINCVSKAVIVVDSKAIIQDVVLNHETEIQIILEIRQTLNFFFI